VARACFVCRALFQAQQAEHDRMRRAGHLCPYVFFREVAEGRNGPKKPQRIVSFGKAWKTACRLAGCPGRIPHDLRRTAVRTMVRRGVPERVAMQLTGHRTPSIFARYNIVSPADLTEAARRMEGLTVGAGTKKGRPGAASPASETASARKSGNFGGAARI
jgi:integrase